MSQSPADPPTLSLPKELTDYIHRCNVEQACARAAHEALRVHAYALDGTVRPAWSDMTQVHRDNLLNGVYAAIESTAPTVRPESGDQRMDILYFTVVRAVAVSLGVEVAT